MIKMTELDWTTARTYTSDERTAIQNTIRKNTQERISATKNVKELKALRAILFHEGTRYLAHEEEIEAQVKAMPEYKALMTAEQKANKVVEDIKRTLPNEIDYYTEQERAKRWVITNKGDLSLTDREIESIADEYRCAFIQHDREQRSKALDVAEQKLEHARYAVQDFMRERTLIWHQLGADFMKITEMRSTWNRGWIGNMVSAQLSHFNNEAQDRRYEKQEKAGIIDENRVRDAKVSALFELAKTEGVADSKKRWGE